MHNEQTKECGATDFKNKSNLVEFYDDRYSKGYMEEWPVEKRQRIFEIVKSLPLPSTGEVLDFGCGNGVFTDAIKQALPGWKVYGMDISSNAIGNASTRYPNCFFFVGTDKRFNAKQFDFLFTHHVLEHVIDLPGVWNEINGYMKEKASILHILPCGNKGSFEHKICLLNKCGIDKNKGNKFFFEDVSHLRRLNTEPMNNLAAQHGLNLNLDYYSHQFYGALNEITLLSPGLIFNMTNPKNSKDIISALKLTCLFFLLLTIKIIRFPANTIDYKRKKMKSYKYYLSFLFLLLLYPFSKLTNIFIKHKANSEWINKKEDKKGSEMYLYYKRT